MFEVTESEPSRDVGHLRAIFSEYKRHGMITAIDDFGAGHSGLGMLADFQPDVIKVDMGLVRNVHADRVRLAIARSIVTLCRELNISVIAEGIETLEEAITMRGLGVRLFQGYLFARPALEQLPVVPPAITTAVRDGHEVALLQGEMPGARLTG